MTYRFYSDIEEPNKMDHRPFLELNMLDAESIDADEIKRFTKPAFDLEKILDTSKDLKYTREVLRLLAAEWANPSEALVRHFAGQIYEGVKTKAVIEQFERATRKAMHQFLTGRISDRLKSALSPTDDTEPVVSEAVAEPHPDRVKGLPTILQAAVWCPPRLLSDLRTRTGPWVETPT